MRRSVSDQVEDWIARLASDGAPETRAQFEAWLAADPERAREYEQHRLLAGLIHGAGVRGEAPSRGAPPRRAWVPLGLAAGALAAAAAAAFFLWPAGGQPLPVKPDLVAEAAPRLTRPVRLQDGTIMILAASAQAAPRIGAAIREVILSGGSARFIVARDPLRPFVVRAGGARIIARSTVFDVDLEPAGARVTSIEGQVEVIPAGEGAQRSEAIRLLPGQVIVAGAETPRPSPASPARVTFIDADGLPLADVVRIANSVAGKATLEIDPSLATRHVTGRFDVSDSGALARRLAAALDLVVETRGDILVLRAP